MSNVDGLSPRELQIAEQYAGGSTYHAIANQLCIAPSTVRTHLAAIYRKLEISSKLELAAELEGNNSKNRNATDMGAIISELALSLEEAISREKALSEVLRIISRSHGDADTVMPSILGYALELCDAEFGILFEYHDDGKFVATFSLGIPEAFQSWLVANGAFAVDPETGLGRLETTREVVNIFDVRAEAIFKVTTQLPYFCCH
ncbi:MAG: histidine kinase [Rhizobiaceae bacterium]|nr:histidine kinase [Rhizobiaceae bacterium]